MSQKRSRKPDGSGETAPGMESAVHDGGDAPTLSHVDSQGRARMVDVGDKPDQQRLARARGCIRMSQAALRQVKENKNKKGDVLTVAEIAGIQAAKRTAEWIPLCHTLVLNSVRVKAAIRDDGVEVVSEVSSRGATGVEMEALTAVTAALLTIYDMCKAADKHMTLGDIVLLEKRKG